MSAHGDIIPFGKHLDHEHLVDYLNEFQSRYDFLEMGNIGKSIFNKSIPLITIGKGQKSVIYIGGHHGMEWITCALLIRFINEFCEAFKNSHRIFDVSSRILYETRKIYIVPMLNPDGIDYAIHGISDDNVLKQRLIRMNNGNDDFSHWQANGRGVDLNHNYAAGFSDHKKIEKQLNILNGAPGKYSGESPESEPETKALCSFVRLNRPSLALTLHTQGEEIFYTNSGVSAHDSIPILQTLLRMTGYNPSLPTGTAAYGGFTEWFIDEFDKPSFTLECGKGENPLPFSSFDLIYSKLRRAMFTIPILI